ncbi:MAG: aminopeptidase [Clostridiales bacterium]|nr:aminopeptidase [Clostridiales bacterium]
MKETQLKKYAELLAKVGLNVQKGQTVFITAGLDQPEFVTLVVEECYKAGASEVYVEWSHQPVEKLSAQYRTLESLSEVKSWAKAKLAFKAENLSCRLFIESEDPDGMNGVDQEKMSSARRAQYPIIKPYRQAMENRHQWCIAAVPGKAWAKKVFPNLPENEALEEMWRVILLTSRADGENPIQAWQAHNEDLDARCAYLNGLGLQYLKYESANGTDFTVELNEDGVFCGGNEKTLQGGVFNPNIPSEEVFTSPKAGKAEGIVYSSKPLSYMGELIENFSVRFENGKVVEVKAEKGEELLKKMVSMDEGAGKLGEVALIPYDSPINQSGVLFYNTLFDENASCHLALGAGFNETLKGFENYTDAECKARGINESMIHVDFMIGAKDLNIVGVTKSGERVQIFKNGNWAF